MRLDMGNGARCMGLESGKRLLGCVWIRVKGEWEGT